MPWTKPSGVLTAKVSNTDLTASFRFDRFNVAAQGDQPEIVKKLRCDFTIASDEAPDEHQGFAVEDALSAAEQTSLKALLAKCRDHALTLAGYVQS